MALTQVQKKIIRFLADEPCRIYSSGIRGTILAPAHARYGRAHERCVWVPFAVWDRLIASNITVRDEKFLRSPNLENEQVAQFLGV